jgi:hypothetical protein
MENRPTIVQGSEDPVFSGAELSDENLICSCGHLLVRNYAGNLLDIGIKCDVPGLPPGEPIPRGLVSFGEIGRFLVKGPVTIPAGVVLSSQRHIDLCLGATRSLRPTQTPLLLPNDLNKIFISLDTLTNGSFGKKMASALRAMRSGASYFPECPLAWAINHIERRFRVDRELGRTDDLIALTFLSGWQHIAQVWSQSPRFQAIARSAVNEFLHTFFTMITASYLSEHGNSVGIDDAGNANSLRPDLYLAPKMGQKLFLEAKALRRLNYPADLPSDAELVELIEIAVKKARKQISSSRPGALVLGSVMPHPGWPQRLTGAAETAMKRIGPKKCSLSAIIIAATQGVILDPGPTIANLPMEVVFHPVLNPDYFEKNPISIGLPASGSSQDLEEPRR